jgi:hypothetical protein
MRCCREARAEAKVSHEAAYEWIATLRHDVEDAIRTLQGGARPAPFDQITLEPAPEPAREGRAKRCPPKS